MYEAVCKVWTGSRKLFYNRGRSHYWGHFTIKSLRSKSSFRPADVKYNNNKKKSHWFALILSDLHVLYVRFWMTALVFMQNWLQRARSLDSEADAQCTVICLAEGCNCLLTQHNHIIYSVFDVSLTSVWLREFSHELFEVCAASVFPAFCLAGWNDDERSHPPCVSFCGRDIFMLLTLRTWPRWAAVLCEKQLQMNAALRVDKEINAALRTADIWLLPSVYVRKIRDPRWRQRRLHPAIRDGSGRIKSFGPHHMKLLLSKSKVFFKVTH